MPVISYIESKPEPYKAMKIKIEFVYFYGNNILGPVWDVLAKLMRLKCKLTKFEHEHITIEEAQQTKQFTFK